jgi:hypothetical protein
MFPEFNDYCSQLEVKRAYYVELMFKMLRILLPIKRVRKYFAIGGKSPVEWFFDHTSLPLKVRYRLINEWLQTPLKLRFTDWLKLIKVRRRHKKLRKEAQSQAYSELPLKQRYEKDYKRIFKFFFKVGALNAVFDAFIRLDYAAAAKSVPIHFYMFYYSSEAALSVWAIHFLFIYLIILIFLVFWNW